MRSNIKPENRRLLEALYYIDEEVLSDVLADIAIPEPSAPAPRKKTMLRSIKYAALLAACALLIGAVFPVITQLVGYFGEGVSTDPPAGTVCESENKAPETEPAEESTEYNFELPIPEGGLTYIEHVGEVPERFKDIVKNNVFSGGYLLDDRIVRYSLQDGKWHFIVTDLSGKMTTDAFIGAESEFPRGLFIDSEKNLLILFRVDTTVGSKPSGYYKILKLSPDGRTVFETDMSTVDARYDHMVEVDGGYVFIGPCDGGKRNTMTLTDISAVKLSDDGSIKNRVIFGGDDYDTVHAVQRTADGISVYFYLHVYPTGSAGGGYKKYDLDFDGNLVKRTDITEDDVPDHVYYYIEGKPYYGMTEFFTEFQSGKAADWKVIEYDDMVLLVYDRFTSDYDRLDHGLLSWIPVSYYYRETVYEGYSKEGKLLWRTAVDSTDVESIKRYYDE